LQRGGQHSSTNSRPVRRFVRVLALASKSFFKDFVITQYRGHAFGLPSTNCLIPANARQSGLERHTASRLGAALRDSSQKAAESGVTASPGRIVSRCRNQAVCCSATRKRGSVLRITKSLKSFGRQGLEHRTNDELVDYLWTNAVTALQTASPGTRSR